MISIRPYQAEGLDFLADRRRAALFDEPGLGKTMQALLAMRELTPEGRILVVCTGDAVGVWRDEVAFWLDEEADVVSGAKANEAVFSGAEGIVVTNYSRLATALSYPWSGVIFDESQMLRNRKTRTLFATVRAAFDDRRTGLAAVPAFFLSGTPIVKAAGDVWPILHLIDKRRWSSYWRFVQTYSITYQDRFGWHVEGVTNAGALWQEIASVGLRRTVAEVQPDLPRKVRQRVPLKMTPRQARLYYQLAKDMVAEIDNGEGLLLTPSVLARETRLRQALVCPRLIGADDDGAALAALLDIASENARPFVVFTPFAQAIPLAMAKLAATHRPMFPVHGGMGNRFHESVDAFKQAARDDKAPILLATVQMGKSWSVSEVTHEVYFLGVDWNVTTQTQAESRLHRHGQKDTVFARYFVHEDTHDLDALDILAGKKKLADVILDRHRFLQRN